MQVDHLDVLHIRHLPAQKVIGVAPRHHLRHAAAVLGSYVSPVSEINRIVHSVGGLRRVFQHRQLEQRNLVGKKICLFGMTQHILEGATYQRRIGSFHVAWGRVIDGGDPPLQQFQAENTKKLPRLCEDRSLPDLRTLGEDVSLLVGSRSLSEGTAISAFAERRSRRRRPLQCHECTKCEAAPIQDAKANLPSRRLASDWRNPQLPRRLRPQRRAQIRQCESQ